MIFFWILIHKEFDSGSARHLAWRVECRYWRLVTVPVPRPKNRQSEVPTKSSVLSLEPVNDLRLDPKLSEPYAAKKDIENEVVRTMLKLMVK
jgi:hypothetical protein